MENFDVVSGEAVVPEIEEKKKISAAIRITKITEKILFFSSHLIIEKTGNLS